MLARITDIQSFETALRWMQAGQTTLTAAMLLTLAAAGLSVASVLLKDERFAHAARRSQYALFAITAFACGLLYLGIFEGYYFVDYISHVTENNETTSFKISALWASQSGSLLFWCFILSLYSIAFAFSQRHNRTDRRLPWTLLVLSIVQFFFFFIMVSPFDAEAAQRSSPFALSFHWLSDPQWANMTIAQISQDGTFRAPRDMWEIIRGYAEAGMMDVSLGQIHDQIMADPTKLPEAAQANLLTAYADGGGMNPALHNYWIAIHPPMLYLGFVGFTIPFAYAVGSLLSGEVGEGWLKPIRLWTMAAWGFLTVGIALGGLWAYEILGWGGYWAWDPVENASFIPWLTATAFIHSVIVSERRGLLRLWSFGLIIITYCMTVIGTFLVRSGIINSVHAFGATGDVDMWFYGFFAVVFMGSLLALIWRAPLLKSDRKLDSLVSREASFLFNNLIFVFIAMVTLVITFWPWITEQLYGESGIVELGQDAFVMINIPLFLLVLLLMGIGPALAWRRNNGRQLLRAFVPPTAVAALVAIINAIWLVHNDLLISTSADGSIGTAAASVRLITQFTLWPICAFTLVCIIMEFLGGAKARSRSTGESMLPAMLRVTLSNRRRYGGYIVHLGVLLIALGIYYSSFYENEGTVVTQPGGFSVLEDKLSGDKYIVYYEGHERTGDWDFLKNSFGRDEQTAQTYKNMLGYVKRNPDKTADEIIYKVQRDQEQAFGGELPPAFVENALPKMVAAIQWGVRQRDNQKVYETFDTTLRIFPYTEPPELDIKPYWDKHGDVQQLLYGARRDGQIDDRIAGLTYARMAAFNAMRGDDVLGAMQAMRDQILSANRDEFIQMTQLGQMGGTLDNAALDHLKAQIVKQIDVLRDALRDLALEGVKLGAEQAHVNEQIRHELAQMPADTFAEIFDLDANDPGAFANGRFQQLKELEAFHETVELMTVRRRNEIVRTLALRMNEDDAAALESMRPLTLTGLMQAKDDADGEVAAAIDAEIATILENATTVGPRMRIFYDKRTGEPKMNEPVKDPYYHRTLSKDVYFILQDARQDGTATFRFFIKPQMTLGLAGLVIIVIGTVLAILPRFRKRRPEVA